MTERMVAIAAASGGSAGGDGSAGQHHLVDGGDRPMGPTDLNAAMALYSQYAVAQRQYAAALAALPYVPTLPYSYAMAAAAAAIHMPQALYPQLSVAGPVMVSSAADPEEVVKRPTPLVATLSSGSSGAESVARSVSDESGSTTRRSSNVNPKAVEEHISRLISENEALLEPSPVLLKRRSYTRQQYGSLDPCAMSSSTEGKCAPAVKSTRSQSLVDLGPSLDSFRMKQLEPGGTVKKRRAKTYSSGDEDPEHPSYKCSYCKVDFRNLDGVQAHELRCAQRTGATADERKEHGRCDGGTTAGRFYPYCNTVNVPKLLDLEPARTSQAQTLIAQTTFCTVRRRPVCHWKVLEPGESVWTKWTLPSAATADGAQAAGRREAQLNVLLIGCYHLRQHGRHSPSVTYSLAVKDGCQMRVTHSAYWKMLTTAAKQQRALVAGLLPARDLLVMARVPVVLPEVVHEPHRGPATSACPEPADQSKTAAVDSSATAERPLGGRCRTALARRRKRCNAYLKRRTCASSERTVSPEEHDGDDELDEDDEEQQQEGEDEYDSGDGCSDASSGDGKVDVVGPSSAWRPRRRGVDRCPRGPASPAVSSLAEEKKSLERCESAPALSVLVPIEKRQLTAAMVKTRAKVGCQEEQQQQQEKSVVGLASEESVQRDIDQFITNSRDEAKPSCNICGKKFNRFGLLRLHMNVHCLEQSSRRHEIKCQECSSSFRSKSLLQKHLACAHPQPSSSAGVGSEDAKATATSSSNVPSAGTAVMPAAGAAVSNCNSNGCQSLSVPTESGRPSAPSSADGVDDGRHSQDVQQQQQPNPRPFMCSDCDVAFRIHGHLAKHLRSKLHIMRLETAGKLPAGTFARIEEAGGHFFQEIDTRSGENSLRSLLSIMERFERDDASKNGDKEHTAEEGPLEEEEEEEGGGEKVDEVLCRVAHEVSDSDELVIDVEGCCSPPPAAETSSAAMVAGHDEGSSKSGTSVKSPLAASVYLIVDHNSVAQSVVSCSSSKSVIAGVWVPPTSEECNASVLLAKRIVSPSPPPPAPAPQPIVKRLAAVEPSDKTSSPDALSSKDGDKNSGNYCHWCKWTYGSLMELNVHRLSDHIVMKDGRDFRCPFANCERVYPNRDCFRQHLSLHFMGRIQELIDPTEELCKTNSNGFDTDEQGRRCLATPTGPAAAAAGQAATGAAATSSLCKKKKKKKLRRCDARGSDAQDVCSTSTDGCNGGVQAAASAMAGNNGAANYSSTSDSEASHLSITNSSPVTSPSDVVTYSTGRMAAMMAPTTLPPLPPPPPQQQQQQRRPSLKRCMVDLCSTGGLASDVKRTATEMSNGAIDATQTRTGFVDKTTNVASGCAAGGGGGSVPQYSSAQANTTMPWHAGPFLKDSISPRSLYGASGAPLLGSQWPAAASTDPTLAALAQAAVAVANPAALFGYQTLCQQFAAASFLGAVQQAQCGAITPALLAAFSPSAFQRSATVATAAAAPVTAPSNSQNGVLSSSTLPTLGVCGAFNPTAGYICLVCCKQCANFVEYQEHMVSHSQPRPFLCEICDAGFTTARALHAHLPCRQQP